MNLTIEILRRLVEPALDANETARRRCRLAEELENAGNYEGARSALGDLWRGAGERPDAAEFDDATRAELLLRAGSLTGWLGSEARAGDAQERAKDLIGESLRLFESLMLATDAARAQIELAWCYWRAGEFAEARVALQEAAQTLPDGDARLRALCAIRLAEVERSAGRQEEALRILSEIELQVATCDDHALSGKFHSTRAGALQSLRASRAGDEFADRAIIELTAASFHFEQAGHTRFCARVENNLGLTLLMCDRLEDAHEHLARARRIFVTLRDDTSVAQVDETRARVLITQGRNSEAEKTLRRCVGILEKCEEKAQLAEALTTLGVAQSRLSRHEEARASFERASEINEWRGDAQSAASALLSALEELADALPRESARELYVRADRLVTDSHYDATLARLRACAFKLLSREDVERGETRAGDNEFIHAAEESATLLRDARVMARGDGAVLICGETGTGKEILARLIHEWSGRRGRFVAVNCAAMCETLFESQLFGHRKGSFTDAREDHRGLALDATGGTLYLDEIGELTSANQAKMLRLLDKGEIYPLGSSRTECVDVRVVAATNHDLTRRVREGYFRRDLYYRLTALQIFIPPLRERPADIPALARHFARDAARRHKKRIEFASDCFEAMARLPLAGNARELRGLVERAFITCADGSTVTRESVEVLAARATQPMSLALPWEGCSFEDEVLTFEKRLIKLALDSARGSVTHAARLLNITHQGLAYMLNARHKDLLPSRKPARTRRVSLIGKSRGMTRKGDASGDGR
jgi:transcriptional regulator with GAF, ATPase, and Fis domain